MSLSFDGFTPNHPPPQPQLALRAAGRQVARRASSGPERAGQAAPGSVLQTLAAPGAALDPAAQAEMSARFGRDFSRVRVHTDEQAAGSARAVNALAYAVGEDLIFGQGQYAPDTPRGRRLIAHELAHVRQQEHAQASDPGGLTLSQPGDTLEQEAEAAEGPLAAPPALAAPAPMVQRQTPGSDSDKKTSTPPGAGEVVADGLQVVAEQAADENPQVKKVIIDPIKDRFKGQWQHLQTGEKAATIGWGAATLGLAGGALLSDPGGRKVLEGVNLATPFKLIPYMPLSTFQYTLPSGDTADKRLFKFETGFDADDLINLRTERRGLPKMSFKVNMQWGYDPASERLTVLGGAASLGLVPGLSVSAGAYKDVLRPPQTLSGPGGEITQVKKSIPEFDKPQPVPDVRIMLNVDLMKFKPGELARQVRGFFGKD